MLKMELGLKWGNFCKWGGGEERSNDMMDMTRAVLEQ